MSADVGSVHSVLATPTCRNPAMPMHAVSSTGRCIASWTVTDMEEGSSKSLMLARRYYIGEFGIESERVTALHRFFI
jgi:hypothetical protein